ncbi:MAG: sensor histidine kinase, partial [Halobacteriaceae archaeon]
RLETFASVLSHDLRNPLNVVTGNLALAEHDDEHVDRAAAAADRMEVLVDDVLTLVKQGQTIGETEQVSLAAVAERAWANVETPAADLDLDREALGTVEADPDRLQEACANLFRNAVEHGGADVRVEVGALDGDEGFYVADDGPGIPEAARETVFEHGYTTDDGTGLGLAIVESVVGAHGWTVSARESERGGARFDIRYRGDGVG